MRCLGGIIDSMDKSLSKLQGVGDGQGGLALCSPWSHKEPDMTERLNRTDTHWQLITSVAVYPVCR